MKHKRAGTSLWRVNYKIECNQASICYLFFCQHWLKHLLVYLASARNWFAVTKQVPEPVQGVRWWRSLAARAGKGRRHCRSVSWHCCLSSGCAGSREDEWSWAHRRCCVTRLLCKRCRFGNLRTHCAYLIIKQYVKTSMLPQVLVNVQTHLFQGLLWILFPEDSFSNYAKGMQRLTFEKDHLNQ